MYCRWTGQLYLMFRIVQEFVETARASTSDDALCDAFSSTVEAFGFEHVAAQSYARRGELPPQDDIHLVRYPKDWVDYYHDRDFWMVDPTLRMATQQIEPFAWRDLVRSHSISSAERSFMESAAEAEIRQGLTIPVHGFFGKSGFVTMYGEMADVGPQSVAQLHNLGVYFYDTARRSVERRTGGAERDVTTLSTRERECLLWLSAGQSDWDVGAMLTISEVEVKRHVVKAMYKLGVPTRTQAVVQAVMSDQIIP